MSPKERVCSSCGSTQTYITHYNNRHSPHHQWYTKNGLTYCSKCNNKLFTNPKWRPINNPIYHARCITYKDKKILLKFNPRKGVCTICGARKGIECRTTHIHHKEYHDDDMLKDTIEVCASCHNKITAGTMTL